MRRQRAISATRRCQPGAYAILVGRPVNVVSQQVGIWPSTYPIDSVGESTADERGEVDTEVVGAIEDNDEADAVWASESSSARAGESPGAPPEAAGHATPPQRATNRRRRR